MPSSLFQFNFYVRIWAKSGETFWRYRGREVTIRDERLVMTSFTRYFNVTLVSELIPWYFIICSGFRFREVLGRRQNGGYALRISDVHGKSRFFIKCIVSGSVNSYTHSQFYHSKHIIITNSMVILLQVTTRNKI